MSLVHRLRRNFAIVLTGNAAIAALGFATLSVNTRALGLALFGTLLVIQSLAELFNRLASFQTWQAINAFGAAAVERGDYKTLERQFLFGFSLDCIGAVLGTSCAIIAAILIGEWVGLPPDARSLAILYASSSLLLGNNSSLGVLRLLDKFGLAMAIQTTASALLLVNATLLWLTSQPFCVYVATTALITASAPLCMNIAAYWLLRVRTKVQIRQADCGSIDKWRFFKFALATSGDSTLNIIRQRGEVLVLSFILGPVAAGLYGVSYRLASIVDRFSEAGRQSVYPEIAKLVAAGEAPRARHLVLRTTIFGASIALASIAIVALFGRSILFFLFGEGYQDAYICLVWMTVSTLTFATLFAALPYVQLTYGAWRFFCLNLVGTVAFALGAWFGPSLLGFQGAGLGSVAFALTFALAIGAHLLLLRPPSTAMVATRTESRMQSMEGAARPAR